MAIYYADSSVLVKRHVPEAGSAWVSALMDIKTNHTFFTASISQVEFYSALNRRLREKAISAVQYARLHTAANHFWSFQYAIIDLATTVIDESRVLLERHPLRAYDAVQLASGLHARRTLQSAGSSAPIFLSADNRLLAAAQAEGFVTDNPNDH